MQHCHSKSRDQPKTRGRAREKKEKKKERRQKRNKKSKQKQHCTSGKTCSIATASHETSQKREGKHKDEPCKNGRTTKAQYQSYPQNSIVFRTATFQLKQQIIKFSDFTSEYRYVSLLQVLAHRNAHRFFAINLKERLAGRHALLQKNGARIFLSLRKRRNPGLTCCQKPLFQRTFSAASHKHTSKITQTHKQRKSKCTSEIWCQTKEKKKKTHFSSPQ